MPILGIDYDKCNYCHNCIKACGNPLFLEVEEKIEFRDPENQCILCGHCIARCPEDAIIYEDIGESFTFEDLNIPENILSYEKLLKFLQLHRSIRVYKKDKVPKDILEKIFTAMSYAPTARNMKTQSIRIISNPEEIKMLSDAVKEEFFKKPSLKETYGQSFTALAEVFNAPIFYDAPHVILVYSSLDLEFESNNIANIITYGRLAAQTLGIGTCWNGWTQIAMGLNPKIMKIAKIRGKKVGVITLGYPNLKFYRTAPRKLIKVKGLN
jgi:nitroreductase/NAD-dependent dihydropyrimidine dehydrogenase PreA subunit